MTDPGIENAARWGPKAALERTDRNTVDSSQSSKIPPKLGVVKNDESLELDGEIPPLIPEGEYVVRYIKYDTHYMFGGLKLFVHFEIIDPGPHCGIKVYRAYRVVDAGGKKGKGRRRFKVRPRSQLFLDLVGLFDRKLRRDRISLACLKTVLLRVRVRTVSKDYKQRPLPESIRYSVISDLIAIEAGTVDG
jgi:hypothetical protein